MKCSIGLGFTSCNLKENKMLKKMIGRRVYYDLLLTSYEHHHKKRKNVFFFDKFHLFLLFVMLITL